MADKTGTVTVTALQHHSYDGTDYEPGDTYDIDETLVASVAAQGKAAPSDPAAVAKKTFTPAAPSKQAKPVKVAKGKKGRK